MMGPTIVYRELPVELRGALEPLLEMVRAVFPPWLALVVVVQESEDLNGVMSIECDYAYRSATLRVTLSFLELNPERRSLFLLHEVMHALTFPLDDVALRQSRMLRKAKPALRSMLEEELRVAAESTATDLATVFYDFLFPIRGE